MGDRKQRVVEETAVSLVQPLLAVAGTNRHRVDDPGCPAPAHDLFGMGQDLCRRLAPSPAPSPPQGKRASLRRRRSAGSAPANGIDAVKRTASIAFGSCRQRETGTGVYRLPRGLYDRSVVLDYRYVAGSGHVWRPSAEE